MDFHKLEKFKEKIHEFISKIKSSEIGFSNPLIVGEIDFLGAGTGNLNILVEINNKKVIFRYCINKFRKDLFLRECSFLMNVKNAPFIPKIRYCELEGNNIFKMPFMILDYIEGKCLSEMEYIIDKKLISELAMELSKIHNLDSSQLNLKKENIAQRIEKRFKFLRKKLDAQNYKSLYKIYKEVLNLGKISEEFKTVIHANIWEGNIIKTDKGIRIIDYETLCLDDPAVEIAHIFHDFKTGLIFTDKEKNLFIEQYKKYRNDKTIKERVNSSFNLDVFDSFLRIIEYSLISHEKQDDDLFKSSMDKNSGMQILKIHFKKLKELGIINKKYELTKFYSPV